ncbi:glycoside hydrolase [Acaromyces ingoldii]|uniref:Alpha-galactosidase n=1 Tax=Acaromyces ingoldii TaxID=215250 RepID=A0A316YE55_9BASI|nr:glycoside hydrolase [Acaromyces ingoldii]PWN86918.1 glycoside hydrolase [Acaromyces ingoldii]
MRSLSAPFTVLLAALLADKATCAFQQTPTLGFNTYNAASCTVNDSYVTDTINAFADQGFAAMGYSLFQIDCGWQRRDRSRDATTGAINVNNDAFPNGIKSLTDLATSRGLNFGLYSDAGLLACDPTVPSPVLGSLGHEAADAKQFADWNVKTVKYDNCYADSTDASSAAPKAARTDFVTRYRPMTDALRENGIEGELVCQWGVPFSDDGVLKGPIDWTRDLATSFRLSDDISDSWDSIYRIYNQAIYIAEQDKTGPGFHADADLLEVGNAGLSLAEQQFHFAYWAMAKSALMVSTDIVRSSEQTRAILQNEGLIEINQDSVGKPVKLVQRWTDDRDLHIGPLANGDLAVLAFNAQSGRQTLNIDFAALNVTQADVVDLYSGATRSAAASYGADVDAHGVIALRLSNVIGAAPTSPAVTWLEAENAAREGTVAVAPCSGCSGGEKVGDISGYGNNLIFNNVEASQSSVTVLFDYVNCEIGYLGNGLNERKARIAVNGGDPQDVNFPITGYSWDGDVGHNFRVQLSGFNVGSSNSIQISSPSNAPDIDRIGIVA